MTPEGQGLYLVDLIYHYDEADFEVSSGDEEEEDEVEESEEAEDEDDEMY